MIGLGVFTTSLWLHAQKNVYAYMTVFVRSASDSSLVSSAGLILACGLILTIGSIIGLLAVLKNNQKLLLLVRFEFCCTNRTNCVWLTMYINSQLDWLILPQLSCYYHCDDFCELLLLEIIMHWSLQNAHRVCYVWISATFDDNWQFDCKQM